MSALTKVFVVLHVVLSLLVVAGMVTFVNKVEDFRTTATKSKDETIRERAAKDDAIADARNARSELADATHAAEVKAQMLQQEYNNHLQTVGGLNAQIAAEKLRADKAAVDVTTALGAQKAAQEAQKVAQDALLAVRKESDDLRQKYSDASVAISDLQNKLDVMNKRYQQATEEKVALQTEIDGMKAGGGPTAGFAPPAAAPGAPGAAAARGGAAVAAAAPVAGQNLKGVVRSRKNIQGVEYATISLGSADNVQKGMEFMVIDRAKNQFLGYLTVQVVGDNDATGQLRGPKVEAVRTGNEVVNQWQ